MNIQDNKEFSDRDVVGSIINWYYGFDNDSISNFTWHDSSRENAPEYNGRLFAAQLYKFLPKTRVGAPKWSVNDLQKAFAKEAPGNLAWDGSSMTDLYRHRRSSGFSKESCEKWWDMEFYRCVGFGILGDLYNAT